VVVLAIDGSEIPARSSLAMARSQDGFGSKIVESADNEEDDSEASKKAKIKE